MMNWQEHKQLYESMNIAKLQYRAREQWKLRSSSVFENNQSKQIHAKPKLRLIQGDKK